MANFDFSNFQNVYLPRVDEQDGQTQRHQWLYTATVNHKGMVVAFAMDQTGRIYYSVLELTRKDANPVDARNWFVNEPQPVEFATELAKVGYGVTDQTAMPIVDVEGKEWPATAPIAPEDVDTFMSSTGRLSAVAPFQVLSDQKHIFLFRQSLDASRLASSAVQAAAPLYLTETGEATTPQLGLVGTVSSNTTTLLPGHSFCVTLTQGAKYPLSEGDGITINGRTYTVSGETKIGATELRVNTPRLMTEELKGKDVKILLPPTLDVGTVAAATEVASSSTSRECQVQLSRGATYTIAKGDSLVIGSTIKAKATRDILIGDEEIYLSTTSDIATINSEMAVTVSQRFLQTGGTVGVFDVTESLPLVSQTLLVDRFVLVNTGASTPDSHTSTKKIESDARKADWTPGYKLQPKQEVRFRRSRSKSRPQSTTDSLGAKDMNGRTFYEPTQALTFVKNLNYSSVEIGREDSAGVDIRTTSGSFSVLLLPTQRADIRRWQIFACDSQVNKFQIKAITVQQSADGLFDTEGTQFYTSPDPAYQDAVLETGPGTCPYTKKPLIPINSPGLATATLILSKEGDLPPHKVGSSENKDGRFTALLYYQQEDAVAGHSPVKKPLKRQARVMFVTAGLMVVDFGVSREGYLAGFSEFDDKNSAHSVLNLKLLDTTSSVQMPVIYTAEDGLTIMGGRLNTSTDKSNSASPAPPQLYAGATGDVALYYQSPKKDFSVVYFNTRTVRSQYQLPIGKLIGVLSQPIPSTQLTKGKASLTIQLSAQVGVELKANTSLKVGSILVSTSTDISSDQSEITVTTDTPITTEIPAQTPIFWVEKSQLTLIANTPGTERNNATITVADNSDGSEFCDLILVCGSTPDTETWKRLPRDVNLLANILNGVEQELIEVGQLNDVSFSDNKLTLGKTGLSVDLNTGDTLNVLGQDLTVKKDVEAAPWVANEAAIVLGFPYTKENPVSVDLKNTPVLAKKTQSVWLTSIYLGEISSVNAGAFNTLQVDTFVDHESVKNITVKTSSLAWCSEFSWQFKIQVGVSSVKMPNELFIDTTANYPYVGINDIKKGESVYLLEYDSDHQKLDRREIGEYLIYQKSSPNSQENDTLNYQGIIKQPTSLSKRVLMIESFYFMVMADQPETSGLVMSLAVRPIPLPIPTNVPSGLEDFQKNVKFNLYEDIPEGEQHIGELSSDWSAASALSISASVTQSLKAGSKLKIENIDCTLSEDQALTQGEPATLTVSNPTIAFGKKIPVYRLPYNYAQAGNVGTSQKRSTLFTAYVAPGQDGQVTDGPATALVQAPKEGGWMMDAAALKGQMYQGPLTGDHSIPAIPIKKNFSIETFVQLDAKQLETYSVKKQEEAWKPSKATGEFAPVPLAVARDQSQSSAEPSFTLGLMPYPGDWIWMPIPTSLMGSTANSLRCWSIEAASDSFILSQWLFFSAASSTYTLLLQNNTWKEINQSLNGGNPSIFKLREISVFNSPDRITVYAIRTYNTAASGDIWRGHASSPSEDLVWNEYLSFYPKSLNLKGYNVDNPVNPKIKEYVAQSNGEIKVFVPSSQKKISFQHHWKILNFKGNSNLAAETLYKELRSQVLLRFDGDEYTWSQVVCGISKANNLPGDFNDLSEEDQTFWKDLSAGEKNWSDIFEKIETLTNRAVTFSSSSLSTPSQQSVTINNIKYAIKSDEAKGILNITKNKDSSASFPEKSATIINDFPGKTATAIAGSYDEASKITTLYVGGENGEFWKYQSSETANNSSDSYFYPQATVKGCTVRSQIPYIGATSQTSPWHHLAATYQQSYALSFDGRSDTYLDCGNHCSLNILNDLTIEVTLQARFGEVSSEGDPWEGGILAKDSITSVCPYALYLKTYNDSSNKTQHSVVFAFSTKSSSLYTFNCNPAVNLSTGQHQIAITRKIISGLQIENNQRTYKQGVIVQFYIDGDLQPQNTIIVQSGDVAGTMTDIELAALYPAGKGAEQCYILDSEIAESGDFCRIGQFPNVAPYQGSISDVRLWEIVRPASAIGAKISSDASGLVAWWPMEEGSGNIAYDAKGDNNAKIRGARWIDDPNPQRSSLELYYNGSQIATEQIPSASPNPAFVDHLKTTNKWSISSSYINPQTGTLSLDEVRVWDQVRTPEELQDNLFRPLQGAQPNLLAHYTFDDAQDVGQDSSGQGNHISGLNASQQTLSTAPIGPEMPQVSYLGAASDLAATLSSQPSITEYADLQYAADGTLTGAMKRCYSYISNGTWHLLTGYKVGNIITEWLAQVQADPQIIGYIEGAPPVPSENLTSTDLVNSEAADYAGTSAVELEQTNDVTFTFGASKESAFDTSLALSAGFGLDSNSSAGLGFATSVEKSDVAITAQGNIDYSNSLLDERSYSYGQNQTQVTAVELRGAWEDDDGPFINPNVGRRFIPDNTGVALVKSDTMDIFALRLEQNNALVGYRVLPNPDIPKDINLINFPINPIYTKQGTLDGKVGLKENGSVQCDPDYPNAATYGPHSYFKPKEAYQLKKEIERNNEELAAYYAEQEAQDLASYYDDEKDSSNNDEEDSSKPGAKTIRNEELHNKTTTSIVNTYVWTAAGGLYAESNEKLSGVMESISGTYSFAGMGGVDIDGEFAIAKVGIAFGVDALFGGHLEVVKTKARDDDESFALNVNVEGDSDLQVYVSTDADKAKYPKVNEGGGAYDALGKPILRPGKVDAYRFMTFFKEPTHTNFEDFFHKVVDPIWLAQSNDPNAIALRQTNQSGPQPTCWRIFHRVTFVSRILPEFDAAAADPIVKATRQLNLKSNWELLKTIESSPAVKKAAHDYVAFTDAVRTAVKSKLPSMVPHTQQIVQFMCDYYGVTKD
ncbi:MAG: hypothetical protein F6J87_02400 [Spirulina sp. SIO3F2]|nr:hypothetical protein [Spirulina sp. SIO3F2]